MHTMILGTLGALALVLSSQASYAAGVEDAAYDKNNQPIYSSTGSCVRTKWDGDNDACGAKKEAKPAKVSAPVRAAMPVKKAPTASLEQRTVYFDFNSASLTTESKAKLDALADLINRSSAITDVRIHGFTDQMGSSTYNDALATKRAHAVKSYLDGKSNVKASGIDLKGLGKSDATEGCDTLSNRSAKISCMAKERRVEVELKVQ